MKFLKKHANLIFALGWFSISVMQVIGARKHEETLLVVSAAAAFFVAVLFALQYFLGKTASGEPDDVGVFLWVVRHFRNRWQKRKKNSEK